MRPFYYGYNSRYISLKSVYCPLPHKKSYYEILILCGSCCFFLFVVIFIKVVSNRNKKYFQQNRFYSSSDNSFVPTVVFYNAKCTFCLNGSVHPQKCSLDTFKIFNHFLMHRCKFAVDPNGTVFICLFTVFCVRTARAIFTLIHFFLTSILVSLYVFAILKIKVFPFGQRIIPSSPIGKFTDRNGSS